MTTWYYTQLLLNSIVYIEGDKILVIGPMGTSIAKLDKRLFHFYFLYYGTFLSYEEVLFCTFLKHHLFEEECKKIISELVVLNSIGYRIKFKIAGRGYKLHFKNNFLFFKLGYGHCIYECLSFLVRLKKKKKRKTFYTICSLDFQQLSDTVCYFSRLRSPNVYTRKGIFGNNKTVLFKVGKMNVI